MCLVRRLLYKKFVDRGGGKTQNSGVKSLCLLALLAPCAVLAQTKDISGTWVAKMSSPMGQSEVVYELKVDSTGKITGTQKLPFGDSPIVDGHVDGDKVTMTVENETFGTLTRSTATADIVGDELHITPAMPTFRRPRQSVWGRVDRAQGHSNTLVSRPVDRLQQTGQGGFAGN